MFFSICDFFFYSILFNVNNSAGGVMNTQAHTFKYSHASLSVVLKHRNQLQTEYENLESDSNI